MEGVYFFGGKNEQGECTNKLKYFKPVLVDQKIIHGDFELMKT